MIATVWQDLRHGARMLVKNPAFALVAVVSIAIGVGVNAAMFSVTDGLVLRPLPVPEPGNVMTVSAVTRDVAFRDQALSHPEYVDLRDEARSFEGLVAYRFVITSFAHRLDEPVQRKVGMAVSGNHFDVMRVPPALGRTFRPGEDRTGGRDAVVVLDHDEWTQQFGADPGIIDRRIRIGAVEFTVIGVAAAGFTGIDHDVHPAFYIPLAMFSTVQPGAPPDESTRRDARTLTVKGRLRPGVTIAQARQEVEQIAAGLAQRYPATNKNRSITVRTQLDAFNDGPSIDYEIMLMLMTLALAVLGVACANVAGLLTSRAPVRARETALRLAIGASRSRVIRQLVTESVILAAAGGALGLLAANGVIALFQRLEFPTDVPLKLTFALDRRVLVVGVIVAAASAILSSVVPAWAATRTDLVSALKNATGAESSRRFRLWGRNTMVCAQMGLSLMLLTVSMYLYRAFQADLANGPGFRTDHLLTMAFDPGLARYDAARTTEFYRLLTDKTRRSTGVTSVALSSAVPMKPGGLRFEAIAPEGVQFSQGRENVFVATAWVDEGYFETMSIRIVGGRAFRQTDTMDAPRVAVVNQTLAARHWPGQNPIGKRIRLDSQDRAFAEIVGVAANSKYFFIAEQPTAFLYLPHLQSAAAERTLLVATAGDAAAMAGPVRDIVRSIDPNMPIFGMRTMEDFYFSRAVHTTRLIVGSAAGMGVLGVILAMVGLYGLVAYAAARRTREIGVRMAVGATPASVLRMVLRHGFRLAVVGVILGVMASVGASRLVRVAFTNMQGIDLGTYLLVVPALVAIVMLAAYLPARRAARVDPLLALHTE